MRSPTALTHLPRKFTPAAPPFPTFAPEVHVGTRKWRPERLEGRRPRRRRRMSEYEAVQRGPLRLKAGVGVSPAGKRKKKKDKEKSKIVDQIVSSKMQEEEEEEKRALDKRTPAQLAYEKMQEKRQIERILKKASKTHKQRVEDFNRHLDTLTEHYDIPKVSWTK